MQAQEPIQKFQLIQDSFSPSQARRVVKSMLDSYIQHYNLEYMQSWEACHNFDSEAIDEKINFLKSLKRDLEQSIDLAETERVMLKLEGLMGFRAAS
jgi:hypothetical protein